MYDLVGNRLEKRTVSNGVDELIQSKFDENHTGYSQVLEERTTENGGTEKVTTYTIGHDVLSQYDAVNGFLALLSDGHGSTRAIADMLGTILQQYNYDAYGNTHGFNAAEAMTNLLYSGEELNPTSGLQYLRARWYNPATGTFNRFDPFSGNKESPLSFHKYTYTHANPINGIDPTGESILSTLIIALAVAAIVTTPFGIASLAYAAPLHFIIETYNALFVSAMQQTLSSIKAEAVNIDKYSVPGITLSINE